MVGLSVAVIIYQSRDKLTENFEDAKTNPIKGERGPRGLVGPEGMRGEQGLKGNTGGSFIEKGRISNIGCLEDSKQGGSCHAGVNSLSQDGGLGKKSYKNDQIWVYNTDKTIQNIGNNKCLNVSKNNSVGSDNVLLQRCDDDSTKWDYDSEMRLLPKSHNDEWVLSVGKDNKLNMVGVDNKDYKQRWTFHA